MAKYSRQLTRLTLELSGGSNGGASAGGGGGAGFIDEVSGWTLNVQQRLRPFSVSTKKRGLWLRPISRARAENSDLSDLTLSMTGVTGMLQKPTTLIAMTR